MLMMDDLRAVDWLVSITSILIGAELAAALFMRVAYGDRMDVSASPIAVLVLVVAVIRIRGALTKQSAEIASLRDTIARRES